MLKDVSARYYDGQSALAQAITFSVTAEGVLSFSQVEQGTRPFSPNEYQVELPIGKTSLLIRFGESAYVDVPYDVEVVRFFESRSSWANRMMQVSERKLKTVIMLCLTAVVVVGGLYWYGLPLLVTVVKPVISYNSQQFIGQNFLNFIEEHYLAPTSLSEEKQRGVAALIEPLRKESKFEPEIAVRVFKGGVFGANAFALLPNFVVVTDEIREELSDDQLQAVLAHELGHLVLGHSLEQLLRSSLVSVAALLLVGGDPGTLQSILLAFLEAGHSREQEAAADDFAAMLLKDLQKDPRLLGQALKKIAGEDSDLAVSRYLSSHPLTEERIARLEEFALKSER